MIRTPAEEPPPRTAPLFERDLDPDPIAQFRAWFADARSRGALAPDRMVLATVAADGSPSARVVLLRGVSDQGFAFFTHYRSRKGKEIESNPRVALVLHWHEVHRQVRIEGRAQRLSPVESDAYFDRRPVGSRIGAIVSPQSETIASRETLHRAAVDLARRLRQDRSTLRRPEHWGGFLVAPTAIELWQAGRNRLHDRLRYRRDRSGAWQIERLAP